MNKPAPMADDVLELTKACAEAMGYKGGVLEHAAGSIFYCPGPDQPGEYSPASDPAQAFELLCWLAERGVIYIGPKMFEFDDRKDICEAFEYIIPADLRLAIMRAVMKVKENQGGR